MWLSVSSFYAKSESPPFKNCQIVSKCNFASISCIGFKFSQSETLFIFSMLKLLSSVKALTPLLDNKYFYISSFEIFANF